MGSVLAQETITDQVAIAVFRNHILGITAGQGLIRYRLSAGENVLATRSRGLNAFAHTSDRLLAFSGPFQRWFAQPLDLSEQVIQFHVSPRFILAQTNKRVFGFQAHRASWRIEEFGTREQVIQLIQQDHVAVVVTNRRVLGFSAFTGGFFAEDLGADETIDAVTKNDNIVILQTSARQLIFRSNLAIWADRR
ncbi:MAG: hypothetical protein GKS05_07655 [Nitrospirales bacterium]|nr:hypothetical protein [Nitrospirales bacterium]